MKSMYKSALLLTIVLVLFGCSKNDTTLTSMDNTEIASTTDTDYFSNLSITDVSTSKDIGSWKKIMGKITNNNPETVMGYIQVAFYDSNGSIVDTTLIGLPVGGIKSGATELFSKTATQKEFSTYEFFDSTLMPVD